jgi:AAA+ superfamily predicted ATPase
MPTLMDTSPLLLNIQRNSEALHIEMEWLRQMIDTRLRLYFNLETQYGSPSAVPLPDLSNHPSALGQLIRAHNLDMVERTVLALALAPHVRPEILDGFMARNKTYDKPFTEFGGLRGTQHQGFLPTIETAFYLVAGSDIRRRALMQYVFDPDFLFQKLHVLALGAPTQGEPRWSGRLDVSPQYVSLLTNGANFKPDFSSDFPAQVVNTQLDWKDLVLRPNTRKQVQEILDWIEYGDQIMGIPALAKRISPGFKALFHGPPGTGKTLTASLLGKSTEHEVYKIDLSQLVSKYIGETEKNLAKVFDLATHQRWILFFDEADALFSRRTETSTSNDRYANQETAYLLQRIEAFPGVVILASNLKDNIDPAFMRRFQAVVHFPAPEKDERFMLWTNSFPGEMEFEAKIDFRAIAEKYKLAGGAMMNVVRYSTVRAFKRGDQTIRLLDIEEGLLREFEKEGIRLM